MFETFNSERLPKAKSIPKPPKRPLRESQVVSREAVVLVLVGLPARGKSFISGAVLRRGCSKTLFLRLHWEESSHGHASFCLKMGEPRFPLKPPPKRMVTLNGHASAFRGLPFRQASEASGSAGAELQRRGSAPGFRQGRHRGGPSLSLQLSTQLKLMRLMPGWHAPGGLLLFSLRGASAAALSRSACQCLGCCSKR